MQVISLPALDVRVWCAWCQDQAAQARANTFRVTIHHVAEEPWVHKPLVSIRVHKKRTCKSCGELHNKKAPQCKDTHTLTGVAPLLHLSTFKHFEIITSSTSRVSLIGMPAIVQAGDLAHILQVKHTLA